MTVRTGLIWIIAVMALVPTPAAAYIDPVSGSLLLQVLAAGALAGMVTVRRWWWRFTSLFRRGESRGAAGAE